MILLQRVTTEYVDAEDRMRLTAADAEGVAVQLWVTQRMLNRLLPHLFAWLERQAGEGEHAVMMQEFAQQAARDALEPSAPVAAATGGACRLCHEVDFVPRDLAVGLTFKVLGDDGESRAVGTCMFASRPLRQWLSILGDQFAKAEWPRTAWPDWFTPAAPTSTTSLH
ncbi:MAG TPA: hypothetical protein VFT37_11720 [Telluria sp.]|nr:hypothetical protein [Telluria sp.]